LYYCPVCPKRAVKANHKAEKQHSPSKKRKDPLSDKVRERITPPIQTHYPKSLTHPILLIIHHFIQDKHARAEECHRAKAQRKEEHRTDLQNDISRILTRLLPQNNPRHQSYQRTECYRQQKLTDSPLPPLLYNEVLLEHCFELSALSHCKSILLLY
jgi:hypothetical protein